MYANASDTFRAPAFEEYAGHKITARPVSDGFGGFNCHCTIVALPSESPFLQANITGSHATASDAYAAGMRNSKALIDSFGWPSTAYPTSITGAISA